MDAVDNPVDVPLPLDGLPQAPDRRRVAPPRGKRRSASYHRLTRGTRRCDDCMANHVDNPGSPLALVARYERRMPGHPSRLLCYEHVQHWREFDAMPRLEDDQ